MSSITSPRRRARRVGLTALALTAGLAVLAPSALAQSESQGDGSQATQSGRPHRPQLTDEQKQCLEDAGVSKPAEGQRPTDEQREAFRAAAEKCGIELPAHPGGQGASQGEGAPDDSQNQGASV